MIADFPMSGIGSGRFKDTYTCWYEPTSHNDHLETANSDILHLGAERGMLIAFSYILLVLVVLFGLFGLTATTHSPLYGGFAAALASLLISGSFSNLITFPTVAVHFTALWTSGLYLWITTASRHSIISSLKIGFACAGGITLIILILSWWIASRFSFEPADELGILGCDPRHRPPLGSILIVPDVSDSRDSICRSLLRPFASAGWSVRALDPSFEHPRSLIELYGATRHLPMAIITLGSGSEIIVKEWSNNNSSLRTAAAAVLCDVDPRPLCANPMLVPCPVLLVQGTLLQEPSDDLVHASFLLHEHFPQSHLLSSPWGTTWSRLGPQLVNVTNSWLSDVIGH